jgi:hypothetical protein
MAYPSDILEENIHFAETVGQWFATEGNSLLMKTFSDPNSSHQSQEKGLSLHNLPIAGENCQPDFN